MERNRRGRPRHPDVLTPAEWRVLDALREGGTNAEIAARLNLSLDTVKYHISNMLAKLELRDRRALASWRPEERRGRLGALFTVPADVWAVARPIAWVGAGTAAVAGVVVGVVAVVALVAVVLVTAGGDADPPLAVAPSPTQTPTPSPTPTRQPSPTPTASPTLAATATPTATPTPLPSPTPPPSAAPAAALVPTPTLIGSPVPPVTRDALGIRQIELAEALAAEGITRTLREAGEEVPFLTGLYLLNVETGAVDGWEGGSDLLLSSTNQIIVGDRFRHDRSSGLTHAWDAIPVRWSPFETRERLLFRLPRGAEALYVAVDGSLEPLGQLLIQDDAEVDWWESAEGDRFVFTARETGRRRFLVTSDSLRPLAEFALPGEGQSQFFPHPDGGLTFATNGRDLYLFRLEESGTPRGKAVAAWRTPFQEQPTRGWRVGYQIVPDGIVAFGPDGHVDCRVVGYGWNGEVLSDASIGCVRSRYQDDPKVSADGTLLAAVTSTAATRDGEGYPLVLATSIFDAGTGFELVRVKGVGAPRAWLADGSGIQVNTSTGVRGVNVDGRWIARPSTLGDSDIDGPRLSRSRTNPTDYVVVDRQGQELASLRWAGGGYEMAPDGSTLIRGSWGATRDELRVRFRLVGLSHEPQPEIVAPLSPVIERPPFADGLFVEVVVGTCLNLRTGPSRDEPIVTCLRNGTIAETDDFELGWSPEWMHIRTDDGVEGWAHADYLRWHSDGVRLEE